MSFYSVPMDRVPSDVYGHSACRLFGAVGQGAIRRVWSLCLPFLKRAVISVSALFCTPSRFLDRQLMFAVRPSFFLTSSFILATVLREAP
jgi:hypothetical protein